MLVKILKIFGFIIGDILVFIILIMAAFYMTGNKYIKVEDIEVENTRNIEVTTEVTTEIKYNSMDKESPSPYVNWLRDMVNGLRNK